MAAGGAASPAAGGASPLRRRLLFPPFWGRIRGARNTNGTARSAVFTLRVSDAVTPPLTGDGSHLGLWAALALLSLCGLGAQTFSRRRQGMVR